MSIKSNYKQVLARIESACKNSLINQEVCLLAVSKKQALEKIIKLNELGHKCFGESYVQEAVEKIEKTKDLEIEWHFIGPIQSNKTKYIAQYFDWVQSVDSEKILKRLNTQRADQQKPLNVLLQVNVTQELSKRGFTVDELLNVAQNCESYENLRIRGIMSIPAPVTDYQEQLAQFQKCRDVYIKLKKILPVDTMSLGMSMDLEAAIESGSTMVRVGTDLFGKRQY